MLAAEKPPSFYFSEGFAKILLMRAFLYYIIHQRSKTIYICSTDEEGLFICERRENKF
jgi:hypothetical protein